MIRSSATRLVLPLVVFGVVVSGCSTNEPGTPSPGTNTATSASETDTPPTSTSAGSGASLATYKPCDELNAVASQLGLTSIAEDGTQECKARYATTVAVRVKAFRDIGLDKVEGGPNAVFSDTSVGSRKAKLVKKAFSDSACAVALQVTANSRVDVVASANISLDEACDAATKVATAIEPKLPK